jgi:hypothetical protein
MKRASHAGYMRPMARIASPFGPQPGFTCGPRRASLAPSVRSPVHMRLRSSAFFDSNSASLMAPCVFSFASASI